MNKIEYGELIAFHPGYYVKEYIENKGMTQEELAKRLQTTPKYVSDLVNGRIHLTDEMVLKLSIIFDTSTTVWLNLNQKYIEKKIEIEKRKKIDEECSLMKQIDYKYWVDLRLVPATRDAKEKVENLQRFFKVSSLHVLSQKNFLIQYKTSVSKVEDIHIVNANAWVQTAINIGSLIETDLFDKKKLEEAILEIRTMTMLEPIEFQAKLKNILANCGVALVLLPNLKNSGVNGAVKWLGKDKVVLALNDCRKYADTFWFALFHELGHVLQQRVKVLFVNENHMDNLLTKNFHQLLEDDADQFARDTLIPLKDYETFLLENTHGFTKKTIYQFSQKIQIHPGIIVGRLQKEGRLSYRTKLNELKVYYKIL